MDCKKIEKRSSSCQPKWKYDVFLSFRGEDTRNNFIDHLFGALHRKGIVTFKDDVKLKKGESISSELLQAIEGSQILIVVFSQNYASSTWCLQELARIADCTQVTRQSVLPIFYDVNPSEVRKQSGNFEKAFVEYEERFKENLEMVQRWREALTQVANLSGWDVRDKPQYKEIEKIIKEIACLLDQKLLSLPNDIVGIHSSVEELEKLLNLDSDDDVRVVGICGMGGIEKTTLATTVYDRISNQFEGCCFIDDVSKIYEDQGPIGAQKALLCQTLDEENLRIFNLSTGTKMIKTRLRHMKALIVLDNVDQSEQLKKLAKKGEWQLGAGSRIIVVSRDEHILRDYEVDAVYKVQLLSYHNALQLFCREAFKCDDIMQDYINLTDKVLAYGGGLPLAIKVLGSLLCDRSVPEWKNALARLREYPRKDIMDVLRISFDALEDVEKEIFLDIACFNSDDSDEGMEHWRNILDIRGFYPDFGLKVLIDKSLITCERGFIKMHNLLRTLGRTIIIEKSPKEPRMWSRLWDDRDFVKVMLENKDAENVEVLNLYRPKMYTGLERVKVDALSKMSRLQLLIMLDHNLYFSGSLNHLSNELRYLSWIYYPFMCLPSSFHPKNLVELILRGSRVTQLWEGTKDLPFLRTLNLEYSKDLIKMPNFGEFPNLELLNLEGCIKLVQIDASIGILTKLVRLNLSHCKSLVSIPYCIFFLCSLEELDLYGCSKLFIDPSRARYMENVNINESSIESQSRHGDSIGSKLPSSLSSFPLQRLDLSFCNLLQIPYGIGELHCLEVLCLGGNKFDTLPSSIKLLSRLVVLHLEHCEELKYLPELPSTTVCPVTNRTDFSRCGSGLYIYDCPKWGGKYSMLLSWIIHLLKILIQPSVSFDRINIVVPGTKIARWFNIQSSTSIDLSPVLYDEDCIAVAFCATFVVHPNPDSFPDRHLRFQFCSEEFCGPPITIPLRTLKGLITSKLTHRLILLFNRQHFLDYYVRHLNPYHITFTGEILRHGKKLRQEKDCWRPRHMGVMCSTVKKIGYRCIYKEHLQQLNPSVRKGKILATD